MYYSIDIESLRTILLSGINRKFFDNFECSILGEDTLNLYQQFLSYGTVWSTEVHRSSTKPFKLSVETFLLCLLCSKRRIVIPPKPILKKIIFLFSKIYIYVKINNKRKVQTQLQLKPKIVLPKKLKLKK